MHAYVGCICVYAYMLVHFLSFDLFANICCCSYLKVCFKTACVLMVSG